MLRRFHYITTESIKYSEEFFRVRHDKLHIDMTMYIGDHGSIENTDVKIPHEAIRVTDITSSMISLEPKINSVYSLKWKTTMESCMNDAVYEVVRCEMTALDEHIYTHTKYNIH